ncbi:MAG: hypothetical protein IPF53_21000 [Blastocatellia bacterium]|nr:hypothetical protein [Blastocatellia bacterium]
MSWIVTEKVQDGPACDEHVTVVVPTGKNDPDAGLQVIAPQLPVDVGAA